MLYRYLSLYLFLINAVGFLLMHIDKQKARKNQWRIPEATLFSVALAGGSLGVFLGMYSARHKTRKPKFAVGIPVILAAQTAAYFLLIK